MDSILSVASAGIRGWRRQAGIVDICKTVGFCCPGCIEKWDALTDAEKTEKLAADKG